MSLDHPALVASLRLAHSAERAAAFAYIGHAGSLKNEDEKQAVQRIEQDEWEHREHVLAIMTEYGITASRWLEFKFYVIGKFISASCYIIGRFMPYFFAGKLESGNVCEYFVMMQRFRSIGITKHDKLLYEMGMKEKEHEVFFLELIKDARWLPLFEKVFSWGNANSANDVDLEMRESIENADRYCRRRLD